MDQGWSLKKLIREIVLSRAYRLSTDYDAQNFNTDPDNIALWRMNRRRLEVEAIRDSILMICGNLDLRRPAESPIVEYKRGFDLGRPPGGTMPVDYASKERYRSVYVPLLRSFIPPMFDTFDFSEPSETKGRRDVTTVATQALFLMNDPFVIEQSRAAAANLLRNAGATDEALLRRAYRETLGRVPTGEETARSLEFVRASLAAEQGHEGAGRMAWGRLYQVLFGSTEFLNRN